MNDFPFLARRLASDRPLGESAPLFLWRGAGIVLLGQMQDGRWVLARGWLTGDRLEHIRRWSFAQPIHFSRQVRRLVMEALNDPTTARAQGVRALTWAERHASAPGISSP